MPMGNHFHIQRCAVIKEKKKTYQKRLSGILHSSHRGYVYNEPLREFLLKLGQPHLSRTPEGATSEKKNLVLQPKVIDSITNEKTHHPSHPLQDVVVAKGKSTQMRSMK